MSFEGVLTHVIEDATRESFSEDYNGGDIPLYERYEAEYEIHWVIFYPVNLWLQYEIIIEIWFTRVYYRYLWYDGVMNPLVRFVRKSYK